MLPLAYLREQPEKIKEGLAKRNFPQPELVDQLLETDQKKRINLYQKMDALVLKKAPVVVLFYDEVIRFTGIGVTGLGINPTNLLELKNVQKN